MHMMNAPPRIYNSLDFYVDLLDKYISSIYFAFLFVRILLCSAQISIVTVANIEELLVGDRFLYS